MSPPPGTWAEDPKEATPFLIEWTPDLLPLSRLGELRAERPGLQRHHRDVLRGLQAHLLSERERSEGRARQAFHTAVLTASRVRHHDRRGRAPPHSGEAWGAIQAYFKIP